MKICILNGSPKGERGVSLQYALYLQKRFPEHDFSVLHVAKDIKKIEKDSEVFRQAVEEIRSSDGVLWAFPLYVLLVHADLKRFIELIFEREAADDFAGKYVALIATSIHFYDHTAINYMQAVSEDLGMKYAGCFSAHMSDLMDEKKREDLVAFGGEFLSVMEAKEEPAKTYAPVRAEKISYTPSPAAPLETGGIKTLVLTDTADEDTNIGKMVRRFADMTDADIIDLSALKIVSGCIGCIACAFDNDCVFHGRDDVEETYARMAGYDCIVFAGEMRDRYLSALWKRFIDRRFFKNHVPHYTGKQIGYLVSGPLSQNANLLEIFEGMAQLEDSNYCGALSDEYPDSAEIDARMDALAKKMIRFAKQGYIAPATFLGVAGRKLFRDEIWGPMRFPFRMDHKYFKKEGLYDFPQKNIKSRIGNAFMLFLIKFPKAKKSIRTQMNAYMVEPYKKILQEK